MGRLKEIKPEQKFPLRYRQQIDEQRQAWTISEEERKRRYREFQAKKKQGIDTGRYNEVTSAKTKLMREYDVIMAKKRAEEEAQQNRRSTAETKSAKTGALKKPTSAESVLAAQPKRRPSDHEAENGNPQFNGNFVTLTKEQLRFLLAAAEASIKTEQPKRQDTEQPNNEKGIAKQLVNDQRGQKKNSEAHLVEPDIGSVFGNINAAEVRSIVAKQPDLQSLADRKKRQWAIEREQFDEWQKESQSIAALQEGKKQISPRVFDNTNADKPPLSFRPSESLRDKKYRQWQEERQLISSLVKNPGPAQILKQTPAPPVDTAVESISPRRHQQATQQSLVEKKAKQWASELAVAKDESPQKQSRRSDIAVLTHQQRQRVEALANGGGKSVGIDDNVVVVSAGAGRSKTPPAAMRSAFAIGDGGAPDEHRYDTVKQRERQQWLDDLKRQMDEKKARHSDVEEQRFDEPPHSSRVIQVEHEKRRPVVRTNAAETDFLQRNLQEAERETKRWKLLRRIEKLRKGGHDTSGLERAHKDMLTPRDAPINVPTDGDAAATGAVAKKFHLPHGVTRILTPNQRHYDHADDAMNSGNRESEAGAGQLSSRPSESCAVQTDEFVFASGKSLKDLLREATKVEIEYRGGGGGGQQKPSNKQATNNGARAGAKGALKKAPVEAHRRDNVGGAKHPWFYQNKEGRPALKASDREVALTEEQRKEREMMRKDRMRQLMELTESNMANSRLLAGVEREHRQPVQAAPPPATKRRPSIERPVQTVNKATGGAVGTRGVGQQRSQPGQPIPQQADFLPFRRSSGGLSRGAVPPPTGSGAGEEAAKREDQVRQHLKSLKQNLMRRAAELERGMSPNTLQHVRESEQFR